MSNKVVTELYRRRERTKGPIHERSQVAVCQYEYITCTYFLCGLVGNGDKYYR